MSSPVFRTNVFTNAVEESDTIAARMTLPGTAHKALILLALVILGVTYSWGMCQNNGGEGVGLYIGAGLIISTITCLITCFVPRVAWFTAPVYSVFEGVALGAISFLYATATTAPLATGAVESTTGRLATPGLVLTAVGLTLGVFAIMLVLYSFRILRATPAFVKGVFAATLGIALLYVVWMVLSLFQINLPLFNGGVFGIGLSLVVVTVAALNLILDFNFIEMGVRAQAPKYMEWYGAFGLMVTLIWLYLEILRLLAQLNRR
jgi:uncharacterized YccA/Bax inhibitor family protein